MAMFYPTYSNDGKKKILNHNFVELVILRVTWYHCIRVNIFSGFTILIVFLRLEKFKIIRHNNLFIELLNAIFNEIGLQFEAIDKFFLSTLTHLKIVQSFD